MTNGVRVVRNSAGMRRILQAEGLEVSRKVADQILAIVGTEHYEIEEWVGQNRGRATVRTKPNGRAMAHEARTHDLVRALGSVNQ